MSSGAAIAVLGVSERLTHAVGLLAGRIAALLAQIPGQPDDALLQSHNFLRASHEVAVQGFPSEAGRLVERAEDEPPHPIDLLIEGYALSDVEVDLLLLAAMPDEHEGYSGVLRSLHPKGEPRATVGLAAQVLFAELGRRECRRVLELGPLVAGGIVKLAGDVPLFDRSLILAEALWPALHGLDVWPPGIVRLPCSDCVHGLQNWFASPPAVRAKKALHNRETCTIAVVGEDAAGALHRTAALVEHAGQKPTPIASPFAPDAGWLELVRLHATLRGEVPVLRLGPHDSSTAIPENPPPAAWSGPLVISGVASSPVLAAARALISVPLTPLEISDRRGLWSELVPSLADSAAELAARYPIELHRIEDVARDLHLLEAVEDRPASPADVAQSLRARAHRSLSAGVRLVHPQADWEDLVLSPRLMAQLREAVDRLKLQSWVLDDWGFLKNRCGARGVRLLFAGPPGTGKTLSAEVLAHALEADLLVVDVARVVSKWVGETEKNLAAVFDAAEDSQAVLLFDEADALFAKRTEVSDAHDRYANLETAYLLQRLERFDGLAILSTNLRQNIDAAFVRRLEFVLEFGEPDSEQRVALWKHHIPAGAPRDPEVDFHELAALYPVVGGVIRNAAVAAAFRAAAGGVPLCRQHFIHAIQREYDKAGRAFPGLPAGMKS